MGDDSVAAAQVDGHRVRASGLFGARSPRGIRRAEERYSRKDVGAMSFCVDVVKHLFGEGEVGFQIGEQVLLDDPAKNDAAIRPAREWSQHNDRPFFINRHPTTRLPRDQSAATDAGRRTYAPLERPVGLRLLETRTFSSGAVYLGFAAR
jgi:hypothetical protein